MQQSTTAVRKPQASHYPVVSHRLVLMHGARRDAQRHHINPDIAIAAVEDCYRATHGDRFAARRAGWKAVNALAWPGVGEG